MGGTTPATDYDALAKQYGAVSSSEPAQIDYDALARQHGVISSTPDSSQSLPAALPTQQPKDNLSPFERRAVEARSGNPLNLKGQAGVVGKAQASLYGLEDTMRQDALKRAARGETAPIADAYKNLGAGLVGMGADLTGLIGQPGTSVKNAALTAGAMTPYVRTALSPYFLYQGLKTALTGRQPGEAEADFVQRVLLGSGMAVGSVGGGARIASPKDIAISGKGFNVAPNEAADVQPIINFARRAKSINDINSAGTALLQGKVMPQVHKLHAAIHGEVERTANTLIQADEADLSNVNQGTIFPTKATTNATDFINKTGFAPDPQSVANKLSTDLNNSAGMKFKDAKLLRSRIGSAEAAAYRRGDNLTGGYLAAMRSGLSDAMASRAGDLGLGKAWDHYNNEANSMFDFQRHSLFGDLLESRPGPQDTYRMLNGEDGIMPLVKRLGGKIDPKATRPAFSGDVSQVRDWMQKYGLNVKDWDTSLEQARSLAEAHQRTQSGFGQGLYRMVMNHPEHALLPLGVYAAMHGAGIYGFAPFLAASAVGSLSAKGSSLADAGRVIRDIRSSVPPAAYQTMTEAQGPQTFQPNTGFPPSSSGDVTSGGPGGSTLPTAGSGPAGGINRGNKPNDFRPTDYQAMNPQEMENLSKQAGRPLTQDQAMEFLKRQAAAGAVQQMLKGKGPLAGDGIEKDVKTALTNNGLLSPRMIESAVRAIRGQYNNFNDAYRAAMAIATKAAIEQKGAASPEPPQGKVSAFTGKGGKYSLSSLARLAGDENVPKADRANAAAKLKGIIVKRAEKEGWQKE